jgi:hypothetical protein
VKVVVTGGYFDASGEGVVWHLDFIAERAEVMLRWVPPPLLKVATKGFAGGSLSEDGTLFVAAHAAVVRIDPRRALVTGILHQPCMNDLHDVAVHEGLLYVSNTGLGAVDVFGLDGTFLGSHALLPAWANARRIGGLDLPVGGPPVRPGWSGDSPEPWATHREPDGYHATDRFSAPFHRLKVPDHLHVNHVTPLGNRLIATCFADGCLRDLQTFAVVKCLPELFLHDGQVEGHSLWLTAINGTLVELNAATLAETRRLAVFETGHYGWCRGLAIDDNRILVGLTEVREDRLPRHRWADRNARGSETSVLLIERSSGRLLSRIDLSDKERHSKLYSIVPLDV